MQHLGQSLDLWPGPQRTAANDDQRPPRRDQKIGGTSDRGRIGTWRHAHDRCGQRDLGRLPPDIDRALQSDRPGTAGRRGGDGLGNPRGRLLR